MTTESKPRRRLFLFMGIGGLLAILALPAAFASSGDGFKSGFGHSCHRGEVTAEQVQKRADRFSGRILDQADATDEQRAEVEALLVGIGERVVAHKAEHAEVKAEWRKAFLAEEINEVELEALRADMLDRVDDGSSEMLGLATDLASVLTAEQRADLAELADRWHK
jgi:Spy/CpxP family protein refolding chaperone